MAKINFTKMPLKALLGLRARLDIAIEETRNRERAALREKIESVAREAGLSVADLFGTRATKGRKVAPKYRNPDNHAETWTGRGRRPRWLAAKMKSGGKVDAFLIG